MRVGNPLLCRKGPRGASCALPVAPLVLASSLRQHWRRAAFLSPLPHSLSSTDPDNRAPGVRLSTIHCVLSRKHWAHIVKGDQSCQSPNTNAS